jgi:hypothetical protein
MGKLPTRRCGDEATAREHDSTQGLMAAVRAATQW